MPLTSGPSAQVASTWRGCVLAWLPESLTCGPGGADVEKNRKKGRARARDRTRDASVPSVVADHWARRARVLDLRSAALWGGSDGGFLNLTNRFSY